MEVRAYLEKMKSLQKSLLLFLENKTDEEENLQNLLQLLEDYKIKANTSDFKMFLRLISKISENNQHFSNYFDKIKSVIDHIKTEIKQTFSNQEIFEIFKRNNKFLLFLVKSNIIVFDESLYNHIKKPYSSYDDYLPFFFPEFKKFLNEKDIEKYSKEITDDFEEKRKIGENDNYICELIRNDNIDEFTSYVKKNNFSINSKIKESLFETNRFIQMKTLPSSGSSTLIEYAAYFGSVRIFKYLYSQNVQMKPKLLTYSIHGANMEIFHILEKNKSLLEEPKKRGISALKNEFGEYEYDIEDLIHLNSKRTIKDKCLIEAILCHHNEMVRYILKKWFKKKDDSLIISKSIRNLNFEFIEEYFNCESTFYYLCKHDYYKLAELLLKTKKMNVSKKAIQIFFVLIVTFNTYFLFYKIMTFFLLNKTPLFVAIRMGNIDIIKLLFSSAKINVNTKNIFALHFF